MSCPGLWRNLCSQQQTNYETGVFSCNMKLVVSRTPRTHTLMAAYRKVNTSLYSLVTHRVDSGPYFTGGS